MAARWIETLSGSLKQKEQYKQAKARIDSLPGPYKTVANAMHRYFMYYGEITDGDTLAALFSGLADLWEQAAAEETPISEIAGSDPVDFAETFAQAYGGKLWIDKERQRLIDSNHFQCCHINELLKTSLKPRRLRVVGVRTKTRVAPDSGPTRLGQIVGYAATLQPCARPPKR